MSHRETQERLPELAAGALAAPDERRLRAHVAECRECREWLETYDLLAASLGGREPQPSEISVDHPASSELALWAVEGGPEDGEGAAHLESCPECRRLVELSRRAAAESGEAATTGGWRLASPGAARGRLAAAAVLALAISAALFFGLRGSSGDQELSGRSLAGHQEISAAGSIRAQTVEIASGSEVRFAAADQVVLGEDFVVRSDATFTVDTRTE